MTGCRTSGTFFICKLLLAPGGLLTTDKSHLQELREYSFFKQTSDRFFLVHTLMIIVRKNALKSFQYL